MEIAPLVDESDTVRLSVWYSVGFEPESYPNALPAINQFRNTDDHIYRLVRIHGLRGNSNHPHAVTIRPGDMIAFHMRGAGIHNVVAFRSHSAMELGIVPCIHDPRVELPIEMLPVRPTYGHAAPRPVACQKC